MGTKSSRELSSQAWFAVTAIFCSYVAFILAVVELFSSRRRRQSLQLVAFMIAGGFLLASIMPTGLAILVLVLVGIPIYYITGNHIAAMWQFRHQDVRYQRLQRSTLYRWLNTRWERLLNFIYFRVLHPFS